MQAPCITLADIWKGIEGIDRAKILFIKHSRLPVVSGN